MAAGGGCNEDIAMNIKRIGEQQLVRKYIVSPFGTLLLMQSHREKSLSYQQSHISVLKMKERSEILQEKMYFSVRM